MKLRESLTLHLMIQPRFTLRVEFRYFEVDTLGPENGDLHVPFKRIEILIFKQ